MLKNKILLFILFLIYCENLPAKEISYYVKPVKAQKGKVLLTIFQGLDKSRKYVIKYSGRKTYHYKLKNIDEYTVKLIGIPLHASDEITISLLEDDREIMADHIILAVKKLRTSHIKIDKKYVVPPKKLNKRLEEEYLKKDKAKSINIPERYFYGAPVYPVINGKPGTPFGAPRVYNKEKKSFHMGQDISAPKGTPIQAIFNGRVVLAEYLYYTGNTVMLHHGDGLISLYAHMDKLYVLKNQMINKGSTIGTVGSTGRSTGPHLHLSVYVNKVTVDPMSIFEVLNIED